MTIEIFNNDCWEYIKTLEENSIDHIITDPPYDIGFMNKGWDKNSIISNPLFWKECLRVLKPGGYLLAFSHSRTAHRQTTAIEDAGFEIRDTVMWLYGSGFPKSTNAAIAIDKKKKALAHRGKRSSFNGQRTFGGEDIPKAVGMPQHQAITEEAKKWQGWGSNLKPAYEPVVMARKPLEGTIADNVEKWATGAINIDACRIETTDNISIHSNGKNNTGDNGIYGKYNKVKPGQTESQKLGRFPANVIMDEEAGKILDEQTGVKKASFARNRTDGARPFGNEGKETNYTSEKIEVEEDDRGASRFFYCAKVNTKERGKDNNHPTVKPIKLMEYLIKLVTREGQKVLDPFMGSGSTGVACKNLNRSFVGVEKEKEYFQISRARLDIQEDQ